MRSSKRGSSNTIKLPMLHKGGQRAIYMHKAKYQVVSCGRRFGKTTFGKVAIAEELIKNAGEVWWIAPQYKMSTSVWREMLKTFTPHASWISAQERTIELKNGGRLVVWAADKSSDTMRGGAPTLAIFDEAAMLPTAEAWFGVVLPALAVQTEGRPEGRACFLSTPRGRNWFHDLYKMGDSKDPKFSDYKSWKFPSYYSPYVSGKWLNKQKDTMPEKFFQQEFMAEFMLDAGDVFRGVIEVSTEFYKEPYIGNFVFGVDWGRKNDFTVVSIIDIDTHKQVSMERFSQVDWDKQRDFLINLVKKWRPRIVAAEENSMGDVIISNLREKGVDVTAFYTTNKSKREIIELLSLDIEKKEILLLNDSVQVHELQAYQMKRTPSGNVQYNAAIGFHDDTVMALAIANKYVHELSYSFGGAMPRIKGWDNGY